MKQPHGHGHGHGHGCHYRRLGTTTLTRCLNPTDWALGSGLLPKPTRFVSDPNPPQSQQPLSTNQTTSPPFKVEPVPKLRQIDDSLDMDNLANAFSVLELDADDDRLQDDSASTSSTVIDEKEKKLLQKLDSFSSGTGTSAESKLHLPLVWIDLEMSGLDVEVERILEIACIITDGNLTKTVEGPDLVIHQTKECLEGMGAWCQSHHAASGLTERVLQSTISEREAEKQVIEFVKSNVGTYTPLLAGNSVYVDYQFLKKYMPELAALFPHVLVDVSSVKALCCRWYPQVNRKAPTKQNKHRAMEDIRESIKELRYLKANIFKPRLKK